MNASARRTLLRLVVAGLTILVASCADGTAPRPRELVLLFDLAVPSTASLLDTVRIGYAYATGCGPVAKPDVAISGASVRVAVWREVPEYPWPCALPVAEARIQAEVLLPPRPGVTEVTVRFREPGGADSVRTIGSAPMASRAP